MCIDERNDCKHPEILGGKKPGACTAEQIRECHGTDAEHPCSEEGAASSRDEAKE